MHIVPFNLLSNSDIHVDAVYAGDRNGNAGDDPLHYLLGVSIQGGFRILGTKKQPRLIVLTSSLSDPEWPDNLDPETGIFTYYGDNKNPGRELHDTPRYGNVLLRNMFEALHTGKREQVPPVLIFASAGQYRNMIFKGLAVPGVTGLSHMEDLVAVWKSTAGKRFQNYRAKFTILDIPRLSREWLNALQADDDWLADAPGRWLEWRTTGHGRPLKAVRSLEIRTRNEQLPPDKDNALLNLILDRFSDTPYAFEVCAAEIIRMFLGQSVVSIDLTRPFRDGGRDAIGKYKIGDGLSAVVVDFSVEAKCYSPSNSVGVKEISRLISRIRFRQFGILVTTSWIHTQAYKEIKEDGHPIIIISGGDIVSILREKGINSQQAVIAWLDSLDERPNVTPP